MAYKLAYVIFFVPISSAQIVPPAVTQIVSTPLIQKGYNVIVSPAVTQIDPPSIRLALDDRLRSAATSISAAKR
jgi:hypothetical protein